MAKVSLWKIMGSIFTLGNEINKALIDDQKIDAVEVIEIGNAIAKEFNFDLDSDAQKKLDLIVKMVDEAGDIIKDGKITVRELMDLCDKVCEGLEIDLDTEGITL